MHGLDRPTQIQKIPTEEGFDAENWVRGCWKALEERKREGGRVTQQLRGWYCPWTAVLTSVRKGLEAWKLHPPDCLARCERPFYAVSRQRPQQRWVTLGYGGGRELQQLPECRLLGFYSSNASSWGRRQMCPPPSSNWRFILYWPPKLQDKNSREEAGACTDHIFLVSKVRKPPWPHMHRGGSLEAKGESCQGMLYP